MVRGSQSNSGVNEGLNFSMITGGSLRSAVTTAAQEVWRPGNGVACLIEQPPRGWTVPDGSFVGEADSSHDEALME
eukprot:7119505-Prorocentrum_lima.AAC.1